MAKSSVYLDPIWSGSGKCDADMLLELHRPQDALHEYERSMKADPNLFNALEGAARAAEASGKPETAAKFYRQLLANCPEGDRPELAEAKKYLTGTQSGSRSGR